MDSPQSSRHWQELDHQEGDRMVENIDDVKELLVQDLSETTTATKNIGEVLAFWSCVAGYAESLATNNQNDYEIFPLPWDALHRLINVEFIPKIQSISIHSTDHRDTVRAIANAIWAHTGNLAKPSIRDELHANSVYAWLRGRIDRKSLDCFGAAVTTIAGCHIRGLSSSQLCLSEDHAYERHVISDEVGTCEVAVPGSTKAAQAKRGREIAETFPKDSKLTPQTSWLYMASNPVICDSLPMMLVAVMANINCTFGQREPGFLSWQLIRFKRELLWTLYDAGHMAKFPFGLLELGNCEERWGSSRSREWVTVDQIPEPIQVKEKLYWDAIHINKALYNEAQVYPYLYAGKHHAMAGYLVNNEGEYQLALAMKHFADAARVASKYRYESFDCLQLNKEMTSTAILIAEYIFGFEEWADVENEVCAGTWLLGFLDSLLYWEETSSDGKRFVEILTPTHQYSIGKLLQLLDHETRLEIIRIISNGSNEANDQHSLLPRCFCNVRSKRLACGSLLLRALEKPKVAIREMELAIPASPYMGGNDRSKRLRRK